MAKSKINLHAIGPKKFIGKRSEVTKKIERALSKFGNTDSVLTVYIVAATFS